MSQSCGLRRLKRSFVFVCLTALQNSLHVHLPNVHPITRALSPGYKSSSERFLHFAQHSSPSSDSLFFLQFSSLVLSPPRALILWLRHHWSPGGSWLLPWGSLPSSGQIFGYQLPAVSLSTNCPGETDCIAVFFSFSPGTSQKSYSVEQEAHSRRRQTRNSFQGTSGSLVSPSVKQQDSEPGFERRHFPYEFRWP